ncbi:MAG: TetR/AcrR family transcriptional regulator, partial [Nocardioides sp.]
LPGGRRRTRAVLTMLADHFTSPVFTAALELWVAARTDPELHAAVGPLEQRIGRETHRHTVELLGVDESEPGVRELVQATLDLVRGLGLAATLTDDGARRHRILDEWARVLDARVTGDTP